MPPLSRWLLPGGMAYSRNFYDATVRRNGRTNRTVSRTRQSIMWAMLERYSHIRMAAKREAVKSLNAEKSGKGTKKGAEETTTKWEGHKIGHTR